MKQFVNHLFAFVLAIFANANCCAYAQELTEELERQFSPEIGFFADAQLWYTSVEFTGNVLTPRNNVLGINIGRSLMLYEEGVDEYTLKFCLHYKHYFTFSNHRRVAFYPDMIMGIEYVYNMIVADDVVIDENDYLGKGNVGPLLTLRTGFAFTLKHDSRLLLGLSFIPTLGAHIGFIF